LFTSLRKFVDEGLSIVLITHKLGEVLHLSQTFTALRAGRVTGGGYSSDITESALTELIVGRALEVTRVPRVIAKGRTPLLRAHGLTYLPAHGRAELLDVSLEVAPGEILGIAGVEGNGQNRLSELLSGLIAPTCGVASVAGRNYAGMGTRHAQHLGVGCVSEDRLHSGVAPSLSIAENTASLDYSRRPVSRFGMLNIGFIRRRARELIKSFRVRAANETMAIGALSGGNMQKIVIGRELRAQPKVLIASQPTRGVDIGAAVELRAALTALRDAGTAILLISADLDEVLALSDRIAVLYEGRIVAHFAAEQASPTELGLYMTGLATDEGANGTLGRPFTLLDRKAVSS
jgi:simple sugar transport system ATP-binding protein